MKEKEYMFKMILHETSTTKGWKTYFYIPFKVECKVEHFPPNNNEKQTIVTLLVLSKDRGYEICPVYESWLLSILGSEFARYV